jgi:hypothetical protein
MSPNSIRIRRLVISPGHNYFGHHGQPAGNHSALEVDELPCVAGRGIPGDRFYDYKPDYKGQITFFAWENLVQMWGELGVVESSRDVTATRRNVITEGIDLSALIGEEFEIQGVRFAGTEECRPCYWMMGAIHIWMQGRGGLRARILTDGVLRRSVIGHRRAEARSPSGESVPALKPPSRQNVRCAKA